MITLRESLQYEPAELQFGTSGRRGKVADLTQLEVYINALAEVEYLLSLPVSAGGAVPGEELFFASDLRPSSTLFVAEQGGRGEIAQAIVAAIRAAGMVPVNLGQIPTPALMSYAMARGKASIMVTGSHIPFDRNGYKVNTSSGELMKRDEGPINERVRQVRERLYSLPFADCLFDERGFFRSGHQELPGEVTGAREAWITRFTGFFAGLSLAGKRILVYQHSAVGRDILVEVLNRLGAETIPAGRSEEFVPIDTENIGAPELAIIQTLADKAAAEHGPLDAIVSIDGDSDRPLILGVQPDGRAHFYGGDLVGMIVAEYLKADAVVVPVSCNDAVDRGKLAAVLEPKTRIGSPFVIAGIDAALAKGKKRVCGWEPNGGFLTGSDIERDGRVLPALTTRDAFLPILGVLFASAESGVPLTALFDRLPKRYSRAALIRNFPRATSMKILGFLTAETATGFFTDELGFGAVTRVDTTDGVRISFGTGFGTGFGNGGFDTGDVAHVRPSGNADELRIYAVADSQARADAIAAAGVAEPDGILRRLERAVQIA